MEKSTLSPLLPEGGDVPGEVELAEVSSGSAPGTPQTPGEDNIVVNGRDIGATAHSQLQRQAGCCYLIYCSLCMVLTSSLLVATVWQDLAPRKEARFWRRKLRPWEESGEAFVGAALCTETLVLMRVMGLHHFFKNGWRILDAFVATLTLLCGFFFLLRRTVRQVQDVVEDIDVPMLCIRFSLQPVRMLSTASMVVRAHRLHVAAQKAAEPKPYFEDPRSPTAANGSPLSPALASQIRELLPVYLRFQEWQLVYTPRVHGTSLQTFYRKQAGPNVLVVQDAHGGLFGGFATESWRPQAGAYGTAEAFVFAARNQELVDPSPPGNAADAPSPEPSLEVFWAVPSKGRVIQWSDSKMLGLGHAVVVWDNFLRGSSGNCEAFGCTSPLSPAGGEFVIRDFECWHVGCRDQD